MKLFLFGFRSMLPLITGIIPFGAVMGTVSAEAQMSLFQSVSMNILIFAGASQLAALELMTKDTASAVVIVTGLIINLRFLLYSAALSPIVQNSSLLTKIVSAYAMTDHNYAVLSSFQTRLNTQKEMVVFYLGATFCMTLGWHIAVVAGYIFGNFAPASWALDYAIPLSFVALVMPTLKNYKYVLVAVVSGASSLLLSFMPYGLGLITTAFVAIGVAALLTRERIRS